jgi:selenocysteine-specific elongation factor
LAALVSDDPDARASAAVELTGWRPWAPADLARTAGIGRPETVYGGLVARGTVLELALSPTRVVRVHRSVLADLAARIEATLARMHDESPLSPAVERASLAGRFHRLGDPAIVEAVLAWMQSAGRIEASERGIALPGRGPRLSARDRELLAWIVETYREAGFQPPSVDQLRARAAPNQAAVPKLIALAVAEGQLVKVSSEFYLHAQNERRMRDLLAARLSGGPGVAVGEVREMLGTTRKYAVPLCEYLDRVGFTRREGDLRVLAARP